MIEIMPFRDIGQSYTSIIRWAAFVSLPECCLIMHFNGDLRFRVLQYCQVDSTAMLGTLPVTHVL